MLPFPSPAAAAAVLQGVYTNANGDAYRGSWENDEKNGIGHQTLADVGSDGSEGGREERYEGHWKDGKQHGEGINRRFRKGIACMGTGQSVFMRRSIFAGKAMPTAKNLDNGNP